MPLVRATIFTDPGCPFGYNGQIAEAQLRWHWAGAVEVDTKMIVLRDDRDALEDLGIQVEAIAANNKRLRETYGMPMTDGARDFFPATLAACTIVVGAREKVDEATSRRVLRELRNRAVGEGGLLDDPELLHDAAMAAGIDRPTVEAWLADAGVKAAVDADKRASRSPVDAALRLDHKLGGPKDERRYTAPSAVFERDGRVIAAPGFQPFEAYDVAMAALAPDGERRGTATSVDEVLAWAPYPLATAEVAALRGVSIDQAREELEAAGVAFTPSASDGFWGQAARELAAA